MFPQALAGQRVTMIGQLDQPHTYTFIDDFGAALVTLGTHEAALGQVWHVPSAETLTTRQFLTLVFEAARQSPKVATAPGLVIKAMGLFNPTLREVGEMLYEFEQPFIVDHSKFARAFGRPANPSRDAIRQTLDWYRQHRGSPTHRQSPPRHRHISGSAAPGQNAPVPRRTAPTVRARIAGRRRRRRGGDNRGRTRC